MFSNVFRSRYSLREKLNDMISIQLYSSVKLNTKIPDLMNAFNVILILEKEFIYTVIRIINNYNDYRWMTLCCQLKNVLINCSIFLFFKYCFLNKSLHSKYEKSHIKNKFELIWKLFFKLSQVIKKLNNKIVM